MLLPIPGVNPHLADVFSVFAYVAVVFWLGNKINVWWADTYWVGSFILLWALIFAVLGG